MLANRHHNIRLVFQPIKQPDTAKGRVLYNALLKKTTLTIKWQNMAKIREIPYNYTSFSDKEIILRFLHDTGWQSIQALRDQRETGRSAKMLFEILGDMWIVERNPFIQDDLLKNAPRRDALLAGLHDRLALVLARANNNQQAIAFIQQVEVAIDQFTENLLRQQQLRQQLRRKLKPLTRKANICFDSVSRVAHATDATDWRVEYPLAVLTPDTEQQAALLAKACIEEGLPLIPRGGGTGYTGAAVPLSADTVVINTEKLDFIETVKLRHLPEVAQAVPTLRVGAGAITKQVSEQAMRAGYVFAVDPTSQDASTIGGNIAMNAGGKKAVLWGTTLDNLASWRLFMANGDWLEITRINHNLGKIHLQETVTFSVQTYALDGVNKKGDAQILRLKGQDLRKVGLGKDVTDKVLHAIPAVQKEGCDGLITSAVFIVHRKHRHRRTLCMEFFGSVRQAVPAIVETVDYFNQRDDGVLLAGLEHLDARYIRAINYSTKAEQQHLPNMVLLADIVGDDETAVDNAAQVIVEKTVQRQGQAFIATTAEAQQRFWADRARTAAIAAHTNAFKLNEDVVIPLSRLADYNDGIERINIEYSIRNKLAIMAAVYVYLSEYKAQYDGTDIFGHKQQRALSVLHETQTQWEDHLSRLDHDVDLFNRLQSRKLRLSYRKSIEKPLKDIFAGHEFAQIRQQLDRIHQKIRTSRLFVAIHMHAGDGNVHTNIPVNSNDYQMLHEADKIVARVIGLALALGGVISGEHGIGLTKVQFLDKQKLLDFSQYKQKVDPYDYFNRGKLQISTRLDQAYTPSLRLLSQEALILEATDLDDLNGMIKNCLRCGKCKSVCTTHVPRANLLYSPRNKILAAGLLIEAVLYEEQTRRGIALNHFTEFNDVADHCTVCHRCVKPCPVNIDFGDVTVKIREILANLGQKRFNLAGSLAMQFLNIKQAWLIQWAYVLGIRGGYAVQRLAHRFAPKNLQPPNTVHYPKVSVQVIHWVDKPLPKLSQKQPLRALLRLEDDKKIPIIRDPKQLHDHSEAVFYFAGCGSERLFSEIGLSVLAMLYQIGVQTVIPPNYLCCGYPQTASGDSQKGKQISTANRILFHRMAHTLNYLNIKTVLVSCGTCMDQLLKYEFDQIFLDCRLLDIHEYLMEKGVTLAKNNQSYLYHAPCHDPMKHYEGVKVGQTLLNAPVILSDRCCGEAGTFALARPDIASQVRQRKQEELLKNLDNQPQTTKLLTTCPACQQGLGRYQNTTGLTPDYLVSELVRQQRGDDWQAAFIAELQQQGIERVVL